MILIFVILLCVAQVVDRFESDGTSCFEVCRPRGSNVAAAIRDGSGVAQVVKCKVYSTDCRSTEDVFGLRCLRTE